MEKVEMTSLSKPEEGAYNRTRQDVRLYHNRNLIPFAPESRGSEMKKHYRNHLNVKVMSESKNLRNKWLHLRLSEAEYKKIKNGFSKSTKRNVSDYVRCIIFNKPITIYTRSKSLDDFI
jgi:lipid A disaccharide synthetase